MRTRAIGLVILGFSTAGFAVWGCATGLTEPPSDDGGSPGNDATTPKPDGAACPQYDLNTDPKHCGSCTTACGLDQVCSMGTCKAACDPPTTKCASDAGVGCFDLSQDPKHCGACATTCPGSDAGMMAPGNNNPDAGIFFDGGYDGGIGWTTGTPTCAMSKCGISCPMGTTACEDNVCYDTQNHHDRCGNCNTACAVDEWCTGAKCCAVGKMNCNGTCADVLSDPQNCGGCGKVCPMNTPTCSNGACTSAYVYSQPFVNNVTPTTACTAWTSYVAGLGSAYSSMRISGTNDMVGLLCNDPTITKNMAAALKNNQAYTAVCNGHTWSNCNRSGGELWIDPPAQCSPNNCPSPAYIIRPCIGNANWGGVKTATCTSNPSQTMTLTFQ